MTENIKHRLSSLIQRFSKGNPKVMTWYNSTESKPWFDVLIVSDSSKGYDLYRISSVQQFNAMVKEVIG